WLINRPRGGCPAAFGRREGRAHEDQYRPDRLGATSGGMARGLGDRVGGRAERSARGSAASRAPVGAAAGDRPGGTALERATGNHTPAAGARRLAPRSALGGRGLSTPGAGERCRAGGP